MGKTKEEQDEEKRLKEEAKKAKQMMDEVSRHLQSEVEVTEGKTKEKKIKYFSGAAIVDLLMASKWAEEDQLGLQTRSDAVEFCTGLLANEYFIALRQKKKKGEDEKRKSKSKKKPLKFETVNDEEEFIDSPDQCYMWKYSPMGKLAYCIGGFFLFVVVCLALLPVWPNEPKQLMQYGTSAVAVILGAFFLLEIVRLISFVVIWCCSKGTYHFWMFPNLNMDHLGPIETFKPLYSWKNYYLEKEKRDKKKSRLRESGASGSEAHSAVEEKKTK